MSYSSFYGDNWSRRGRYPVAGEGGALCCVQLQQQQHQDPQEVGGAQSSQQLAEDGQATVVGDVREGIHEHLQDPRHHGNHMGRGGGAVRQLLSLMGGVKAGNRCLIDVPDVL